jgi:flagellar biogenesis protein FliO
MDFFEGLLKTLSSLAVVLALVVLAAAGARRWLVPKLAHDAARQPLRLVHSLSLGGRRNIMVLEVGLRTLVIGATAQHLTLLTEFEHHDEATIPAPAPQSPNVGEGFTPSLPGRAGINPAPTRIESEARPLTWREHLTDAAGAVVGRRIR